MAYHRPVPPFPQSTFGPPPNQNPLPPLPPSPPPSLGTQFPQNWGHNVNGASSSSQNHTYVQPNLNYQSQHQHGQQVWLARSMPPRPHQNSAFQPPIPPPQHQQSQHQHGQQVWHAPSMPPRPQPNSALQPPIPPPQNQQSQTQHGQVSYAPSMPPRPQQICVFQPPIAPPQHQQSQHQHGQQVSYAPSMPPRPQQNSSFRPPIPPPQRQQSQQFSYAPPQLSPKNSVKFVLQPAQQASCYYPYLHFSKFDPRPLLPLQPPFRLPPPSPPHPISSIPQRAQSQLLTPPLPLSPPPPPPPLPLSPPPPPPPTPPPTQSPPPPTPMRSQSPPPPPLSSVPVENQSEEIRPGDKWISKDRMRSGWCDLGRSNQASPSKKEHKPSVHPMPMKKRNWPSALIEIEEERRLLKEREIEKQRHEEKHKQQLKESLDKVLQKTRLLFYGMKRRGSISGPRLGERRFASLLGSRSIGNRFKKQTPFLCKLKFRDGLPDLPARPKVMSLMRNKDRFIKCPNTSLNKMHRPHLYVEPDLGIPLDLLDLSVYNPAKGKRLLLDPEDEEFLRDDGHATPIKKVGFKRKERPTDEGISWLVKRQYYSPLSVGATKQYMTEKQAKEMRETQRGRNILDNFNSRERKIKNIEASFEACKSQPVHATNKKLQPVEILPLLPDFDWCENQYIVATFDTAPTADSETYSKLKKYVRDTHESQAIMKCYAATGSDSDKPDKVLAYMVPSLDEGQLPKDIYNENKDIPFSLVREYHWDVRADDANDPTTYLVAFGESEARYTPLPTKLIMRKKRATKARPSEKVDNFEVPSRLTVRPIVSGTKLK